VRDIIGGITGRVTGPGIQPSTCRLSLGGVPSLSPSATSPYCNYSWPDQATKSLLIAMSYTGFWNEIRKIPPVTRFLCGSSLAVSLPVMLHLLSPYKVIFVRAFVTQKFEVCFHAQRECLLSDGAQLWRIWSSFFFGGMSPCVVSLNMLKLYNRQRSHLHFRAGHDVVCALVFLPVCSLNDNPFQSLFEHTRAQSLLSEVSRLCLAAERRRRSHTSAFMCLLT